MALEQQVILHTERLILKSLTPDIIHELFSTLSEQEICNYLGVDEKGYLQYKEMHELGMRTHRISLFVFQLIDKSSGMPIGECGYHTWNATHRRAEIFYFLRQEHYKRKGLMTEALQQVLAYGFQELNLHRIQALVDELNTPSIKLLNHFGFTKEGAAREDYVVNGISENSECYSLLRWEWDKMQS
jgi:[ribosomal protein S5]-alanine N-acetyltransferase